MPRPPTAPTPAEGERLQRALARAGFGSRRSCEDLIREGRVRIGKRVAVLGDRVDPGRDRITVDGVPVSANPAARYVALHKPAGVTTTMGDPHARRTIAEFVPRGPRLFPVGRLDRESEGLLLLTNDGELAHMLQHPRYGVEKEYLAEVEGTPRPPAVRRLVTGVQLEDGPARAVSARLVGARSGRAAVRIVMVEGRNREVRRMLDAVGHPVTRLVRTRLGPVRLGTLKAGRTRALTPEEVRGLYEATARSGAAPSRGTTGRRAPPKREQRRR
ncbi:MAG TPA: pseudouridine synthase [Actinomycetota bacterium]|nr:pseudouridine synthase [Actinomycetota bacterium]